MKLGIDIRCLQDKWRTGVGEYVWQTLKELGQDRFFEIYGLANAAGRIDLPPELGDIIKFKRGRLPNKIMNFKLWLKFGQSIDDLLNSFASNIDIIWLPNPGFVHLSGKIPVVLTVHDLSFIHYPQFFPVKGKLWYFPAVRSLLKKGLPPNSLIAAVSQHTADDIIQTFPHYKGRIRVIPAGLDERYFLMPATEEFENIKIKYKLPARYLLSLGTIEPRKNYSLLLNMYETLLGQQPDFPCDLVIAGSWGWRFGDIKKLMKKLKYASRIKFIGYVSDNDKPALYRGADIFLFPSLYEGIGMPPLEAMASGVPVVTSHTSSIPEMVADGGILLSPYQPNTWSATIKWLINDKAARIDLVARGLSRAKLFSWSKTAAAYKDIFKSFK